MIAAPDNQSTNRKMIFTAAEAHEMNLDAAHREIASRAAEGEDMSLAYVARDLSIKFRRLSFYLDSDLYCAGRTEDGDDYSAEAFFIMAEDAAGNRWRHATTFPGCRAEDYNDESGWGTAFFDIRPEARAAAERLLARIEAAGGKIDFMHWHEARPCYGSGAYQAYGQHDDWLLERKEAGLA